MSLIQFLLSIHLLAVATGLGIGFSNLVGFRVAGKLGGDMAKGIAVHRESLIPYGDIIFVIILVTGGLLLWSIGGAQGLSPWFQVKMAVVAVWVITYILMRLRVRSFLASRNMALVPRIKLYAHILVTAVVAAIISAVLTFAA